MPAYLRLMFGKNCKILKGTERDIVAQDNEGGLYTVPLSRLEERISSIDNPKVDARNELIIESDGLIIKYSQSSANKLSLEFTDDNPLIEFYGIGFRLRSIRCYSIDLRIPTSKGPLMAHIHDSVDNGAQFEAAFDIGTKALQRTLRNKIVNDQICIYRAANALKNSYFPIQNKSFLKQFGRILAW
jgi:hypothetical protein